MLKKQVFELLSALCVYSQMGYKMAVDALTHYKVSEHTTRLQIRVKVNVVKESQGNILALYGITSGGLT